MTNSKEKKNANVSITWGCSIIHLHSVTYDGWVIYLLVPFWFPFGVDNFKGE